jgi:23S rRNA (adenine2503-C2)-methyltransferase
MADDRRRVKLAVSLHSLDDETRARLMPVTKKFPIEVVLAAIQYYFQKTKLRVTYEYILFDGVNDGEHDLRRLIRVCRMVPCKINIVPFHSIGSVGPRDYGRSLKPTPSARMEWFVRRLREANVTVMVRSSSGEDIDAACGQLAVLSDRRAAVPQTPEVVFS